MESFKNLAGGKPTPTGIETARALTFDFDYPLALDEKTAFEKKFIKYFFYREFGFVDTDVFKLQLENYLMEEAPLFNQLHAAYTELNPYKTNVEKTTTEGTVRDTAITDVTGDTLTDDEGTASTTANTLTDTTGIHNGVTSRTDTEAADTTSDTTATRDAATGADTTDNGSSTQTAAGSEINDTSSYRTHTPAGETTTQTGGTTRTAEPTMSIHYEYPADMNIPEDGGTTGERQSATKETEEFNGLTNSKTYDNLESTDESGSNIKSYSDDYENKTVTEEIGSNIGTENSTQTDLNSSTSDRTATGADTTDGTTTDNTTSATTSADTRANTSRNTTTQNTLTDRDELRNDVTTREGNTVAMVEMYKTYLTAVSNLEYELIKNADTLFSQVVRW